MIIICYNENGNQLFENAQSLEEFNNKHHNVNIVYVFDENSDLISQESLKSENFTLHCRQFGFTEQDYKTPMLDANGRELFLVGFNPRNNKYKCLAIEKHTGRRFKMSPSWAKSCIQRYQQRAQA